MSVAVSIESTAVLVEELSSYLDAWTVCRQFAGLPFVLFFDTAATNTRTGRYSFVTADPFERIVARGPNVTIAANNSQKKARITGNPFDVLAERLGRYTCDILPDLPPFQGGAAGLFGYDLCHHIERLPRPRYDDFGTLDLAVGFYDWVIAFDHDTNRVWVISTGLPEMNGRRRRIRAAQRLEQVKGWLSEAPAGRLRICDKPITIRIPHWPVEGKQTLFSNFRPEDYLATIRRGIEYVHAGDCFQVNIAQRLLYPLRESPLDIYERLRMRNPAPFAGYFDIGDFVIASASPERFMRMQDCHIDTRPIKGTRPRGTTPLEDEARTRELWASAKDRAENVMIVDLLRNDLGRVCEFGTIKVDAVCRVESYKYVHHLVSKVSGRLRAELGPMDLLKAAFPGGSITGAPKVRAMEIIAELEPTARGPYCGCLGYVGFDGTMDTNLLIRTLVMGKGWIQGCVGGGIVADSDPADEYGETWAKAEGMLRALSTK